MVRNRPNWLWTSVIIFLAVAIIAGGAIIWANYRPEQPIEISLPQPENQDSQIYVGGAVNSPGIYTLNQGDSISSLIQAAGGANSSAGFTKLELYVSAEAAQGVQKIDINRAETWLLEALPGIGPALAQRIVDYRQNNGPFRNTAELLNVPGIGVSTYSKFKDKITVADR